MTERHDIVVIGAGIVGVSTALHLLMRGKKVLLIDRREPGRETSYGNAGIMETACVLPFAFPPMSRWPSIALNRDVMAALDYTSLPQYLPWVIKYFFQSLPEQRRENGRLLWPILAQSIAEHRSLMQGTSAGNYWKDTGRIGLYRTEDSFLADADGRKAASELGVPFEILEPAALHDLEPHLKPVYAKGVRWASTARINNPGALVTAYTERFVREGGTLLQTDARKLSSDGNNWHIETLQGGIVADHVVVCAGPWATDILKPLGYHFPMAVKRGYHRHYAATGNARLAHAITDIEYGYVLVSMEQGFRITTGAEFADRDAPPNYGQLERALPRARELFPLGDTVEATPWLGSRPCFTDSMPVIGPAARHTGLWFNFGHGHVGLTTGPATGRLLAEIMDGKQPFCNPAPYRPARFGC